MNDKEIIDKIKKESDNLKIPDTLSPDIIEKKLKSKKSFNKNNYLKFATIAATLAFIVICSFIIKANNNEIKTTSDIINSSENYNEIFSLFKAIEKRNNSKIPGIKSSTDTYDSIKESDDTSMGSCDTSKTEDFSTTNTQVDGVDEGDIIKNDEKYIYSTNGNKINIVETNNGNMKLISTISTDNNYIDEIYISGNILVVIGNKSNTSKSTTSNKKAICGLHCNTVISTSIYDISNKNKISLINTVTSTGNYSSSRLVDDYLYMFSNFYINDIEDKDTTEDYIPYLNNKAMPSDCILIPSSPDNASYVVITSLKISDPKDFTDKKAIVASGNDFYVSEKNIYIYSSLWNRKENFSTETEIIKFSYDNGIITAKASNIIKGILNNSFSMDEYNDNLRLVSTIESFATSSSNFSRKNSLYILDENLELIGSIEDLAPNERIYSARFLGDTGYFVTFRETDPLFSVDLSNPKEPKILGELKIPGFSSYLHPYDNNLLLGIGMEIDENTNEEIGIKLSMFDISDPSNVKEVNKLVLDKFCYSDALYNHKTVFIDTTKNIFGFEATGYSNYNNSFHKYLTYSYDKEKGFISKISTDLNLESNNDTRGLYIGNTLYIVSLGEGIQSFNLDTSDKISEIKLSNN
ncbi:Hypothetical protein CM240_2126 [Clostridium bornimense]|uniref:Secreted protein n=1 Tax=Clostridium bornimense TaxID=1216932 RepID=W6RXU8_9CLOT|nr:beta-propeller domain-containing protein [Clostridium bornimense]CDM69283.1 Hypothetical protein CM240_2126 [Clostridium bornimense]